MKRNRTKSRIIIAAVVILAAALLFLGYRFFNAVKELDMLSEPDDLTMEPLATSSKDEVASTSLPSPSPSISVDEPPSLIPTTSAAPDLAATQPAPAATSGIDLGYLTIQDREVRVLNSISEAMLSKAPCWVESSALPGQGGMCLIYGHRNRTHFRVLKDVVVGDEILFTYQDGRTTEYVVSEVIIHEKTSDWTHPMIDGDTMVLVTCYPFVYSGNAPGKAMVVARMKGAAGDVANAAQDGDYVTKRMKVTYYCPCAKCNGNALRRGAWGAYLEEGMVASKDLAQGTKVVIEGKSYVVEDKCAKSGVIDIFVDEPHSVVHEMGAFWAEVRVFD